MRLMVEPNEIESPESKSAQTLTTAARIPGVRIIRAAYLQAALARNCTGEQIEKAIAQTPVSAGAPLDVVTAAANASMRFETAKVTALSTAAGVPGGFAAVGTAPADIAQYIGHALRIPQKLAYIDF